VSRIEIHAHGRAVIVAHRDLADAESTAHRLWDLTAAAPEPTPKPDAPATHLGFHIERAYSPVYADDCPATVHT
jgi:hypothetical protein